MKFVCDRCGKRFASVDEPAPGRVYRVRCKCGHVILVRGPAGGSAPRAAEARLRGFEPLPPPPPVPAPPAEREPAAQAEAEAQADSPEVEGSAPPRASDDTERELSDDPFLRAAREAAPVAGEAEPIPDDEAVAPADGGEPRSDAPRAERPRLSLGLGDEPASGASRRVLLAVVVALALLAAIAALALLRG